MKNFRVISGIRSVYKMIALAVIAAVSFQACLKDDLGKMKSPEWEPTFILPLINSSMTIKDIVTRFDSGGFVTEDSNHLIVLAYQGFTYSDYAGNLINIPNQNFNTSTNLTSLEIPTFTGTGSFTKSSSNTVNFAYTNGEQIRKIKFKSGMLNLSFSSDLQHDVQFTLTIPSLTKGGSSFSQTVNLTYTGSIPVTDNANIDLTDYILDLSDNGTTTNTIKINTTITATYLGNAVSPSDMINASVAFNSLKFSYMDGYIGQYNYTFPNDTINVFFFQGQQGGTVTVEDPSAKITILNSFGLPVAATFTKAEASPGGPLTASFLPGPINFNSPDTTRIGASDTTKLEMSTASGSNIKTVVNAQPKTFVYAFNAALNPAGNTTFNFVTDTSRFRVNMEVNVPLHGTMQNVLFLDTVDMDWGSMENLSALTFKINIDNGMPVDAHVDVVFADSAFAVLDTLINNPVQSVIPAAPVDANGVPTGKQHKTTVIVMDENRLKKVEKTKRLLVVAVLNTTNSGSMPVKLYSSNSIDVKLAVKASVKF